jgi:hypothetical protein
MAKKKFFFTKKDKEAHKKELGHFIKNSEDLCPDEVKGGQWVEHSIKVEWIEYS